MIFYPIVEALPSAAGYGHAFAGHAGPSGPNFPAKIGYSSCMRNPRSRIGIVGAGHLGTSLARIFLSRGWSAEELLVAHRGSRASLEALEALNLADRSAPTPRVFESDVVFITVRPEDLAAFRGMEIPSRTILVSCLARIRSPLPKPSWLIP